MQQLKRLEKQLWRWTPLSLRRRYVACMLKLWWIPNVLTIQRWFVCAPAITVIFVWYWLATGVAPQYLATVISLGAVSLLPHPQMFFNYAGWALALTLYGVLTDVLDGVLARKFLRYGWKTRRGAYMDPYADKFFGLSVLCAIPLYYGIAWFLPIYIATGIYVVRYARKTTNMRKAGMIAGASAMAQNKTALQMAVKIVFMVDIAYAATLSDMARILLQTAALGGFVISAYMCALALEDYRRRAVTRMLSRTALAK